MILFSAKVFNVLLTIKDYFLKIDIIYVVF